MGVETITPEAYELKNIVDLTGDVVEKAGKVPDRPRFLLAQIVGEK